MSAPPGTVRSPSNNSRLLAIVNAAALAEMISLPEAIDLVSLAMQELSQGLVSAPERSVVPVGPRGKLALMPGAMAQIARFGIKTLSIFVPEARDDLPSHQGVMLLFDSDSGQLLCAIDSHALTALRTAAATAVATRALSRPTSCSLALLGCGSLAPLHVQAMLLVRPIKDIWSFEPFTGQGAGFRKPMRRAGIGQRPMGRGAPAKRWSRPTSACTISASATPILEGGWLKLGQHRTSWAPARAPPARWMTRSSFGATTSPIVGRMPWRKPASSDMPLSRRASDLSISLRKLARY